MAGSQAQAGQRITAAWLNLNVPGAWTAVTPLNGWSNTGGGNWNFQCRQFNSVTVEVCGTITAGTTANGTEIGVLPSAFIPASNQEHNAVVVNPTAEAGNSCEIQVATSTGQIKLNGWPAGGTQMSFHLFVSLDA